MRIKLHLTFLVFLYASYATAQQIMIKSGANLAYKDPNRNFETYVPFLDFQFLYPLSKDAFISAKLGTINYGRHVTAEKKLFVSINPTISAGPTIQMPLGDKVKLYVEALVGLSFMKPADFYLVNSSYKSTWTYSNDSPGFLIEVEPGLMVKLSKKTSLVLGYNFFTANSTISTHVESGGSVINISGQKRKYKGHKIVLGIGITIGKKSEKY